MPIKHNMVAGEGPLVDDVAWNDGHIIDGISEGSKIRLPVLIEEKTIPAGTTSVTFSNLNGDVDGEYLIEGNVILVPTGSDNVINLQPNGDTGANYVGVCIAGLSTTTLGSSSTSALRLVQSNNVATSYGKFSARIYPVTGILRKFESIGSSQLSGRALSHVSSGHWTNTASNITSLVCIVSNGSFSGTIKLYKMVDITL